MKQFLHRNHGNLKSNIYKRQNLEMSRDTLNLNKAEINKQVFNRKPLRKEGLILHVHHTVQEKQKQQRIRFVRASFDKVGHTLALGNHAGNVFLVDFVENKFWVLPSLKSCTALKFSNYNNVEVLVGISSGKVYVLNTDSGEITGELISHNYAVTEISFSHDYMCLTSTRSEAILWDLRSNTKVHVLRIQGNSMLKHVAFMPITNNILACFEDDTVLIWKYPTFEVFKQILPSSWNRHSLKSVAFTRNGRAMVFSGYSSYLSIFLLDTWTIGNVITLPDYIPAVKKIDFIPQLFDGGCNRILGILSSNGILYFLDMEQSVVTNKITLEEEITRFYCSFDGQHLACILKSGGINIYKVSHYVSSYTSTDTVKQKLKTDSGTSFATVRRNSSLLSIIQKQIKEVLDVDKLRAILKEFGQYPDSYRFKIWSQLLELPSNNQQYNSYINHLSRSSFENLEKDYPLENKVALKNLRKLLSNLVAWSPFFAQIRYLPVFVFPFVKIFQNEPVLCFEAVCTVIVNWCQHWYEYFPLPPVNILAMIENLLLEHDPELLKHFQSIQITSKLYAWPLLEAAFSEVLTTSDWCKLWDHILTNEPAFLLTCVAAYNILHRQALFSISSQSEFDLFYHNQNIIDIKRLISKSYTLLNNTDARNHPRQYLNSFKALEVGSYPPFLGFPKTLIDFEFNELDNLRREQELMQKDEEDILRERRDEQQQKEAMRQQEEESTRLKELEKVCRQKVHDERRRVKEQRKRLFDLRRQLHQEELDMLNKSREKVIEKKTKERQRVLEKIISDVEQTRAAEEIEVIKVESDLMKHYSELLRHKIHLEEALNVERPTPEPTTELRVLKKQQQQLASELERIQNESTSKAHLKHLNIATGIAAMDNLIMKIEIELAEQTADRYGNLMKGHSSIKILKLQAETKELELEVSKLLHLLADMKSQETREKLGELQSSVADRTELLQPQESHLTRQRQSHQFKDKISNMSALGEDFKKLKKLIGEARDGYTARPSSPAGENEDSFRSEELAVISLTH